MSFKKNLKIELYYNSMSLKELAEKINISYHTLVTYTGNSSSLPSVDVGVKIAKALNTTVENLVCGDYQVFSKNGHSSVYPFIKELFALTPQQIKIVTDLIHELYKVNYLN